MPCTAKKNEIRKNDTMKSSGYNDVDVVITTREFARMIKRYGIDLDGIGVQYQSEVIYHNMNEELKKKNKKTEEFKMKKNLVLAMAMALGVTASAYAANPFSDVPAGHWAYDSVNKLVASGVIEGYGDGTFGGDRLMTRYEMAQIVAKAMANGANVDKLAAEFADELDNLGVRVAKLEREKDNVKITGEVRYKYMSKQGDANVAANGDEKSFESDLRSRVWVEGSVNDDWSYVGMVENVQNFDNNEGDEDTNFQRAYVEGKVGGVNVTAGRYNAYFVYGILSMRCSIYQGGLSVGRGGYLL